MVFDETLGSLAETIAEFWGVLAFAGFINIAAIVWRNYSGNSPSGATPADCNERNDREP